MLTDARFKSNSISFVSKELQKPNVEAYRPKVVSIGPLHREKHKDLLYMEDIKWQCMQSLLHRTDEDQDESLTRCGKAFLAFDEVVRATYADRIQFGNSELAKIMLLDACFLLEILISNCNELNQKLPIIKPGSKSHEDQRNKGTEEQFQKKEKEDGEKHMYLLKDKPRASREDEPLDEPLQSGWEILEKHPRKAEVLSDLKLLENQIPLFVVDILYFNLFKRKAIKDGICVPHIINTCVLRLFGCVSDFEPRYIPNSAHILELTHCFITSNETSMLVRFTIESGEEQSMAIRVDKREDSDAVVSRETKSEWDLERCAAKFLASRVEIRASVETHEELEHITFGCKKKFEPGRLEIQSLHVTEETEILWRNFIALEQNRSSNKKFSEYALLLKGLVCSEHDVKLLTRSNVLKYDSKKWSKEMVKNFINRMVVGIEIDTSACSEFGWMINGLKEYRNPKGWRRMFMLKHHSLCSLSNTRYACRHLFRIFKRDHASTPWKTLGVIAAIFLLLLTVAQTVLAAIAL